jgi:hypothetical protein
MPRTMSIISGRTCFRSRKRSLIEPATPSADVLRANRGSGRARNRRARPPDQACTWPEVLTSLIALAMKCSPITSSSMLALIRSRPSAPEGASCRLAQVQESQGPGEGAEPGFSIAVHAHPGRAGSGRHGSVLFELGARGLRERKIGRPRPRRQPDRSGEQALKRRRDSATASVSGL